MFLPGIRTLSLIKGLSLAASGVLLVTGCGSAEPAAPRSAAKSDTTAHGAAGVVSGGSRAYEVETLDELAARADVIVRGVKNAEVAEEPADDEGRSGLTNTVTGFDVAQWFKGSGPTSIPLTELRLTTMEDEIAVVDPKQEYVLFLEKVPYQGQDRYILVGGVGAYRVGADGSLTRTEQAADAFPRTISSIKDLESQVAAAPAAWTEKP